MSRVFTRLGSIEFINSLPVDLGILSGQVSVNAKILQAPPAELNAKIIDGELDLSPVSAIWYAQHAKELLLLPDLSISSRSGVQSVLLFSRVPMSDLRDKTVAITGQGRTTPALFQILCQKRYGFCPKLETRPFDGRTMAADLSAMLLIGNDALEAEKSLRSVGYVYDLALEWQQWTGQPFVFALWAVRSDYFDREPLEVFQVHQALLRSKRWGKDNPAQVLMEAKKRIALDEKALGAYFSALSYSWDSTLEKGMNLYFTYAKECGLLKEIPSSAFIEIHPVAPAQDVLTPGYV